MRYAKIDEYEVVNGQFGGMSLYCQGCRWRCPNCFNPETHDFNGGKEWTPEVEDKFIELASRPYIKRISFLGGECLVDENLDGVLNLVNKIRLLLPNKTIWLYSGYTWEEIQNPTIRNNASKIRRMIVNGVDIFIDGRYIDSQRNIQLKYRGSENQRVIDVQKSLKENKVVLYCD